MSLRAPRASLYAFKETRGDLESSNRNQVVQIKLPAANAFSRAGRSQRSLVINTASCASEETYARSCLASSSSIYFSKSRSYPRAFLWRVLDNSQVLELRSVDLSKDDRETNHATVILQLGFPSTIRRGGVALADSGDDVLSVFVLTKSHELLTLTIPTRSFCDVTASEHNAERWCKTFKPASFTLSTPHRLLAGSPEQLVIVLADGKYLKLSRKEGQDASTWQEVSFNDGPWGASLRGLIRWQGNNTVRYDGTTLDQNTAVAAEFSPSRTHLLTVCADHTLKIWNLAKGSNVFSMDLLGQRRDPQNLPNFMLDAGNPEILRVFEADGAIEGDEYYAITYSPHSGGQFKIWAIRDADQGKLGVRFLHSDFLLRPPDPDPGSETKSAWKMVDFRLGEGERGANMELWVLMRSSKRYLTYSLEFNLVDLPEAWGSKWTMTASQATDPQQLPQSLNTEPRDPQELWLEYLFFPGRYPRSILETALSIYCTTSKAGALKEFEGALDDRMSSAIAKRVASRPIKDGEGDGTQFEQYREAAQEEWTLIHQDIQDLEKSRWQPLGLAFDDRSRMPWIIFAGGCAVIHDCDKLETISRNEPGVLQQSIDFFELPSIEDDAERTMKPRHELAVLIHAASELVMNLSPSFRQTCQAWLSSELWQEPLYAVPNRIENYYNSCDFAEGVTDEAYKTLLNALAPFNGFANLTTEHFHAIIEEMPYLMAEENSGQMFSDFGRTLLVRGAQSTIRLHSDILFALFVLVVFIDVEEDGDAVQQSGLNTSAVFIALTDQLRRYDMMHWLSKTVWTTPQESHNDAGYKGYTIMETMFAADVRPQTLDGQSLRTSLTNTVADLLVWITGGNDKTITLNQALVRVQCELLKSGDINLASKFAQYLPWTAWATYIRGRLYMALEETTEASLCFQKAAYNMARDKSQDYHQASAGFLSQTEAAHFGRGLPFYYTHICHLCHAASFPSYVADFAQLAIQFSTQSASFEPPISLFTYVFDSALQTSDIATAYTALTRLPHHNQEELLPSLVRMLLGLPNGPSHLLELPWPPHLHSAIDACLGKENQSQLKPAQKLPIPTQQQRKILAAWRIKQGDFRGAAAMLYKHLETQQKRSRNTSGGPKFKLGDPENDSQDTVEDRGLDEAYLSVINLLACVNGESEIAGTIDNDKNKHDKAWLLSAADGAKRKIVTIADVRKGWQRELDRRSVIESGQWGFGMGDEEEMDLR
ncbi:MAG: hypothetical protein Q9220_001223 [cf. Caloplaca sp. 1 TL-2023]